MGMALKNKGWDGIGKHKGLRQLLLGRGRRVDEERLPAQALLRIGVLCPQLLTELLSTIANSA